MAQKYSPATAAASFARWSAVALILAGVFIAAGVLLHPILPEGQLVDLLNAMENGQPLPEIANIPATVLGPAWWASHILILIGIIGGIVGLPGLTIRRMLIEEDRALPMGIGGTIMLFIGLMSFAGIVYFEAVVLGEMFKSPDASPFAIQWYAEGRPGIVNDVVRVGAVIFILGIFAFAADLFFAKVVDGWFLVMLFFTGGVLLGIGPIFLPDLGILNKVGALAFGGTVAYLGVGLYQWSP